MNMRSSTQTKAESSFTPVQTGLLQRKCATCSQHTLAGGECTQCQKKRSPLQRRSTNQAEPSEVPPIVHEVLNSSGQPLDSVTRGFMKSRFGYDFSQVQVHTDAKAQESAQAVNALAYTVGQHIVFGSQQYAPGTSTGKQLLAHELTHTVQNSSKRELQGKLKIGAADDKLEQEADTIAAQVLDRPLLGTSEKKSSTSLQISSTNSANLNRFSASSGSSGSGGGGGGGTPAPTPGGSCKVDVRATHIGGFLGKLPIWHLFVVYTDGTGTEYYFRGGPGGSCPGVVAGAHGTIISDSGLYVAGTVDWDPSAPSFTVLTGSAACGQDACFAAELTRIDSRCVPYEPTGPNSNTVAKTMLSNCSVPLSKPVAIAPGWGDPVL